MVDEIVNAFYGREHHYGYDYVYTVDNMPKNDDEFREGVINFVSLDFIPW